MANTVEELKAQEAAKEREIEAAAAQAGAEAQKEAEAKGASDEEVKRAVERARQEEKDKLYPQLEALKGSLREIQETLKAEREEKEALKREQAEKDERKRQEKLSDSEKTLEAIRKLEEKLEREREAREASDQRWEKAQRDSELATYKAKAIAAAGDRILPELVSGSTEEEIDRSVKNAAARFEELEQRVRDELGAKTRKSMPRSTNPNTEALEELELDEQLTQVDTDKYLKDPAYREKIQRELATAYGRAAGRV